MQKGKIKSFDLKGQSNEIFDPQFFLSFEPPWATDQRVKIVLILASISPRYSNFSKFRAVSYCAESSSAQYHTAPSQVPRSIILRTAQSHSILRSCAESMAIS